MARTNNPLKIFEPIKAPATVSYLPFKASAIDAAISGRLVPMANTVNPMNSSPTPKFERICIAPFVMSQAAKISVIIEAVNFRIAFLSFSTNSSSNSSFDLYQIKIVTKRRINSVNEEIR